jgi:Peptidase S24-like
LLRSPPRDPTLAALRPNRPSISNDARPGGHGSAVGRRYGSDVTVLGRIAIAVAVAAAGVAVGRVAARARAVGVSGPSMVPTLADGDALVAYPVRRVRPGDVVIARFRSRPDLLVVKRAIRPFGDGWWIEGDNPLVTDDSRKYGEAVVLGRVLFRYWRAPAADRHSRRSSRRQH